MKDNEVTMTFVKDLTVAPNFSQLREFAYHTQEMAYHLEQYGKAMDEALIHLKNFEKHFHESKAALDEVQYA